MTILTDSSANVKQRLADRFLNLIGLRPMTNRDALMEELDALDSDEFDYLVLSRLSDLPCHIDSIICESCKERHDGKCPVADGDGCITSAVEWLDEPNEVELNIRKVLDDIELREAPEEAPEVEE